MADEFTDYGTQSWLSRIGNSAKGLVLGVGFVASAGVLLFWNEGRAVRRAETLQEGSRAVVSVTADRVESANEGALVYVRGTATTSERLSDAEFGVSVVALKLDRVAEMYQWTEHENQTTEKQLGGGTETKTTYDYRKEWSSSLVESSKFRHADGHENPAAMPIASRSLTARTITVGAFTLSPALVGSIDDFTDLPLTSTDGLAVPLQRKITLTGGRLFAGNDPASPRIGDQRIAFRIAPPTPVSLVARQVGTSFEPYRAKTGGTIELLRVGTFSSDEMFAHAREMNTLLTWGLRFAGWLVMLIGFSLLFNPLSVLADVVPLIGDLVGAGAGLLAFALGSGLSIGIVAVAWIAYRPLLGVPLLAASVAIPLALKAHLKRAASTAAPAASVG